MQIEAQAVETAGMLDKFEGSVAALREIERQYGQLQVLQVFSVCLYCAVKGSPVNHELLFRHAQQRSLLYFYLCG